MLETWRAEGFREITAIGKTEPMILSCRPVSDPTVEAREFVVKAMGLPEIYEAKLYAEVFGNLLARELGVPTPTPALVDIPEPLVPLLALSLKETGRGKVPRVGMASGAELLGPGFSAPTSLTKLKQTELADAVFIYAFDLAVQNPDRFVHRPNCLADGSHFLAIDFEMCFSFTLTLAFGTLPPAWKVTGHQLYPRQDHLFWRTLRDARVDWEPVESAYRSITAERLNNLTLSIPVDWKSHENRIFTHLLTLADNSTAFIDELRRSLS